MSEQFSPQNRDWATTILTAAGITGVIFASLVGNLLHWRYRCFLGGAMGFIPLFLRLKVEES